jgi:hypothetical protein
VWRLRKASGSGSELRSRRKGYAAGLGTITGEEHEDARQIARDIAKTDDYVIAMRLWKKVEMLFAYLNRILGSGCLRLRGPKGANDEVIPAATAQNLRKLDKTRPIPVTAPAAR